MPKFQKTPMSRSTPENPESPALTQLSLQVLTQNTMSGVRALLHLERKPKSLCQLKRKPGTIFGWMREKRTCMSPHETRPDSPVETPYESRDPCLHPRRTLTFRPQVQMRTTARLPTGDKSRDTLLNMHGDLTFLRQQQQVPEVPALTREEPQVSCSKMK